MWELCLRVSLPWHGTTLPILREEVKFNFNNFEILNLGESEVKWVFEWFSVPFRTSLLFNLLCLTELDASTHCTWYSQIMEEQWQVELQSTGQVRILLLLNICLKCKDYTLHILGWMKNHRLERFIIVGKNDLLEYHTEELSISNVMSGGLWLTCEGWTRVGWIWYRCTFTAPGCSHGFGGRVLWIWWLLHIS